MRFAYFLIIMTNMCGCSTQYKATDSKFDSYIDIKFNNVVRQQLDMSCGLAALSDVLYFGYDLEVTEFEMIDKIGLKENYSFEDLITISTIYNKTAIALWMRYEDLTLLTRPSIIYIERKGVNHFVTLVSVDRYHIQIKDPAWGVLNYTRDQFESYWLNETKSKGKVLAYIDNSNKYKKVPINKKLLFMHN